MRNSRPIAFESAANELNERAIESPMGARWTGSQLQRMALRLGIHHPLGRMSWEVARAKVGEIWKGHPDVTAMEVIAALGREHRLGINRAWALLRDCRMAAAKRSRSYALVSWYIDGQTAARIRISAIWKRHPEFTARQVIQKLGPECPVCVNWVQKIMNDCWRASSHHSPKERRIGRRVYNLWRGRGAING